MNYNAISYTQLVYTFSPIQALWLNRPDFVCERRRLPVVLLKRLALGPLRTVLNKLSQGPPQLRKHSAHPRQLVLDEPQPFFRRTFPPDFL